MKSEYLEAMPSSDIDLYAQALGIDTTGLKTKRAKVNLVEKRVSRVAEIPVMGMTVAVPIRRMYDKSIVDRASRMASLSDEECWALARDLLGDEQWEALQDRCTDEDGAVDAVALGVAIAKVLTSDELKNF